MTVTATVKTRGGSYEQSISLLAGRWQAVFFDLVGAELSGKASAIGLAFSASEEGSHAFLLDTFGGAAEETAPLTVRHLAPSYRAEGCALSVTEAGSMAVTVTGNGQSIEAEAPALTDFSGGVGIRVRLKNRSNCRSLTLRYTTLSGPEYTEKRSHTVTIPEGSGAVSCLFPIPESYVGRFRIEFDGFCFGDLEILSVSAVPCYTGTPVAGLVEECVIGKNRDTVLVKGSIDAEDAARYADCTLYLYELAAWEELSDFLRRSNIAAADHLLTKIRILLADDTITDYTAENCRRAWLVWQDTRAEQGDFYRDLEHVRWVRFHALHNWRYAPQRDNTRRLHPDLRAFCELSAAEQAKDDYAWELLAPLADYLEKEARHG